jgi:hypothetical protein
MAQVDLLTTAGAAVELGVEIWQVRRALDGIGGVPRVGQYRAVPRSMLPKLRAELVRKGYLKEEAAAV